MLNPASTNKPYLDLNDLPAMDLDAVRSLIHDDMAHVNEVIQKKSAVRYCPHQSTLDVYRQ